MLNQIYVLSVLICLSCTVSGCKASGETGCPPLDAEPPDPEPMSVTAPPDGASFLALLDRVYCLRRIQCGFMDAADQGLCETSTKPSVLLAPGAAEVLRKVPERLLYDAGLAGNCLEKVAASACWQGAGIDPSCAGVLVGQIALGGRCCANECQPGLVCVGGVCREQPALGGPNAQCWKTENCAEGYYCVGQWYTRDASHPGWCSRSHALGEPCEKTESRSCLPGLTCVGVGWGLGTCSQPLGCDEQCESTDGGPSPVPIGSCGTGMICNHTTHRCSGWPSRGETCWSDTGCARGLACASVGSPISDQGTCVSPPHPGDACEPIDWFFTAPPNCPTFYNCVGKSCAHISTVGGSCTRGIVPSCIGGYCETTMICKPFLDFGQTCPGTDYPCRPDAVCQNHVCAPRWNC